MRSGQLVSSLGIAVFSMVVVATAAPSKQVVAITFGGSGAIA